MLVEILFIFAVVILHIMPVITGMLGGVYNAFQTASRDFPGLSWFWLLKHPKGMLEWSVLQANYGNSSFRKEILSNGFTMKEGYKFTENDLWYIGSNDYYPEPGNFISNKNDAFHRYKMMWIFMISFIAASSVLLGMLYMYWFMALGFSVWWLIGLIYILLQASLQYFFQGATFADVYKNKLDSRVSPNVSKLTTYLCALLDDYLYPTTVEPVDYAKITGRK